MTECKTCGIPGHKLQCPERDGGQLKFTATSATDECKACGIDGEYVALREAMLQKSVEHWRKTAERNTALLRQALEALELGRDALASDAHRYHEAMRGYRKTEHARVDAEVAQADAAIAAIRSALDSSTTGEQHG